MTAAQRGGTSVTSLPPAPASLVAALRSAVDAPDRVRHRAADRLAYAHDASHYSLTPLAVVEARNAAEVARLAAAAAGAGTSLTFRSGGTSLSGQAVTDAVLVDTRRHFRDVTVLDGGARVRVEPGVTVRQVNARLARHGRALGPDPASEVACTVGGVIANNSSGMACGVEHNAYMTLESVMLVLPSGTVVDTGAPEADDVLAATEPALHEGLLRLRGRIVRDPDAVATIRRQFAMKNSMGYSLNAFLDYSLPSDILAHLAVGSEGTLGFIAEAVFHTVPLLPNAITGLLMFDQLRDATAALPCLAGSGPAAIELLDAESLRVAQRHPQADPSLASLEIRDQAALLVEYRGGSAEEAGDRFSSARDVIEALPVNTPARFTDEPARRARLWTMRKGLYAAVAGARPSGTTALLEDIVVPMPALAPACEELTALFARHAYERSAIFGHAKDGNLHFMLNERFGSAADLDRYEAFTEDLVCLVLGHGGSLKAEHGTGRIMAPYLLRQYGHDLYDVMREVKNLCDPRGVLNPGVIFDDDPRGHLRNLKTNPTVEDEVDRCVECGYCEPVCPSRDLTTTPRQRIVLRRAIARARELGDTALVRELEDDFRYDGVETCAVDGMCQTVCPVDINTGDLVKRLRADANSAIKEAGWLRAAEHWGGTTRGAAAALNLAGRLPAQVPHGATRLARKIAGADNVPMWTSDLPRGGIPRQQRHPESPQAIYFPSCLSAMFAAADDGPGVANAFLRLCEQAGIEVATPDGLAGLCCGTPWKSKGLVRGYEHMKRQVTQALAAATRGGQLAVVVDATSCTEGLAELVSDCADSVGTASGGTGGIHVLDVVEYAVSYLLPRLTIRRPFARLVLHPTCSSTRRGMDDQLEALARAIATEVIVPEAWGCCGFAGDRGLLHPELTASAAFPEAELVAGLGAAVHASCNRTCEIGMTRATGQVYRHIIELLAMAAGAGSDQPASVKGAS